VLTKGEASGDPSIREKECKKSAELLEADQIFFSELEDTKIDDGFTTITVIENIINRIEPDIIYTHSYKDTHQDHRNTSYATLSAGRRCSKILMYESPTTFRDFTPHVFVDITNEFERKKQILDIFSSQTNKEWWAMGPRATMAIEGLAAYRGFQSGVDLAEAFEVGRLVISANEMMFIKKVV